MSKFITDTIIAQATPPGRGGVGILRLSGAKILDVAKVILGKLPQPRYADYLNFYDINGVVLDKGIALFFPKPNSFTGEDVLELHCHGGQIVINLLLKEILNIDGIRIANPGEFSERAFLNNKIDLVQAEAISDLINSTTEEAARSAMNSLQGIFSVQVNEFSKKLIDLRTYLEAILNFSDEETGMLNKKSFSYDLQKLIDLIKNINIQAHQGNLLKEGIKIVIIGRPNVGKSSLLNALSGRKTAIVTSIAGTTRDLLHEYINIDGIPFHIIDTAGLRNSDNEVEKIGITKAIKEMKLADHILIVIENISIKKIIPKAILTEFKDYIPSNAAVTIIRNKIDLVNELPNIIEIDGYSVINISVFQKLGLVLLRDYLKKIIGYTHSVEGIFLARTRHIQLLKTTLIHLQNGYDYLLHDNTLELIGEELNLAHNALNQITGVFTSTDLLKNIFSDFCIGK